MKICFWTGPSWEPWSPASIEAGGIGGSETAHVHLARHLAAMGHEVVAFGQHEGLEGTYEGVRYFHFEKALSNFDLMTSDVFVSSRDKSILRRCGGQIKAAHKILWMHDIHVGDDWENDITKFDEVYCLSEWAKGSFLNYYPTVDSKKIWVTRNGIEVDLFLKHDFVKNEDFRFTYSSSPDRGLEVLLEFWPDIRKFLPSAELHVYYGFDTWLKMVANKPAQRSRVEYFVARLQDMQKDGVVYHGRVGQAELAESQLRSELWIYPTNFKETSCISAMEAQAAGAVPVTTALAALNETVQHGVLIKPPNTDARYKTEFLEAVKRLTTNSGERLALAAAGRRWALENLSWRKVAQNWHERWLIARS